MLLGGAGLSGCAAVPDTVSQVVVVTAATAEQPRPALGPAGEAALRAAAESDRGRFGLVVAGAPEFSTAIDLVPRRGAEVEHGPRRRVLVDEAVALSRDALRAAAPAGGRPDLLRALADGAQGPPGTLVVADSGITTSDPVDLRVLGWEGDSAAVVGDLRARGELPNLTGWQVVFSGIGRSAGQQERPGLPQQDWLERFWLAVCAGSGARSCALDPVADAPQEPAAGIRSAPPVPVPATHTERAADGSFVVTVPDSRLGVAPGSATLSAGADEALAPIVERYRGSGYRVRVEGFVAFWGDEAYRVALSAERAAAVGARLVELGVAPADLTTVGRAAADGPEASTTAGAFDEPKVVAAGIRRVVVYLEPVSQNAPADT